MKNLILILLCAGPLFSQYVIGDRRYEGRQDMSRASAWIPPIVTSDPAGACVPANRVVMSTASGGLFRCDPLTGTWQSSGGAPTGGAGATSQLTDFAAAGTGTAVLGITCATGRCNVQTGDTVTSFSSLAASCTLASGTYTAYAYIDQPSAALVVGASTVPTSCTGATAAGSITAYPAGAVPLWRATVTSGSISALTDDRSAFGVSKRINITGATRTETATAVTFDIPGGGNFDPSDLSVFWHRHQFSMSFFTAVVNGWNFGGPCAGNTTAPPTAGSPAGPGWSGAGCYVFWPAGSTSEASMPIFLHGATPKAYTLNWTGGRPSAGSGDIYYGISGANTNTDNGVFIRYNNVAANYSCVIRGAGADVAASTITGAPVDLARHRFTITGTTTPNSVSCAIDGGTAVTVTGTIPTMTRALLIAGTPAATTPFWTIEAGLRASGF